MGRYVEYLSCIAGMSTFSTKGGLYECAQKRYSVPDGKKLFTYSFFEKQRLEALVRWGQGHCEGSTALGAQIELEAGHHRSGFKGL